MIPLSPLNVRSLDDVFFFGTRDYPDSLSIRPVIPSSNE